MPTTTYSLNLCDKYVPKWGPWEVLREIVCNAIDADGKYDVTRVSDDRVEVFTRTVPKIGHMIVIGSGTKGPDADTIGQFGEGLKLAALTCIRASGHLTIFTPDGTLTFHLKRIEEFDETILHATLNPLERKVKAGCIVRIEMLGVGTISEGRFLKDPTVVQLDPLSPDHLNIFYRGVWVGAEERSALNDWNSHSGSINRDRSFLSAYAFSGEVCKWLANHADDDYCESMLQNLASLESESFSHLYSSHPEFEARLLRAAHSLWGPRLCLLSEDVHANEHVVIKGYHLLIIPPDHPFTNILKKAGLKTSLEIVPKTPNVRDFGEPITLAHPNLSALSALLGRIDSGCVLKVFRPQPLHADVIIQGQWTGGVLNLWINANRLDNRDDLFWSALVQVATHRPATTTATIGFESSIAGLACRCAIAWLDDFHLACGCEPAPEPTSESTP